MNPPDKNQPPLAGLPPELQQQIEQEACRTGSSPSDIIAQALKNDQIQIVVGYYHLASGKVEFF